MNVSVEDQQHVEKMRALCAHADIGFEDWSTMRILCRKCSEGIPHEHHDADNSSANSYDRNFGFGAKDRQVLENIVSAWAAITLCERNEIELRLE